jgi:hypothetical protein
MAAWRRFVLLDPGGLGRRGVMARSLLSAVRTLAALAANRRHMSPIGAYRFATLAACSPRFVGGELVRSSLLMRSLPSFAGYLALFALIHTSKPSTTGPLTIHNYKPL